jgi:hypothetical protein
MRQDWVMIAGVVLMEVLGSGERGSPNPRRNTSKDFFEGPPSGNKVATCCCFVAGLLPLLFMIFGQEATNRQHVATSETSIFNGDEDYDAW